MDLLIEEIVKIVLTSKDEYLREYDLRRTLENYTEKEIIERVAEHIKEERDEAYNSGYAQGIRYACERIKENFDDILNF